MYKPVALLLLAGCSKTSDTITDIAAPERILEGPFTGLRVAGAADLTGDSTPDIVVSSPGISDDNGVWIFSGGVSGTVGTDAAVAGLLASVAGDVGPGLAVCGDTDGDGHADLLVGAPLADNGKGGAWLLRGPLAGEVATLEVPDFLPGLLPDIGTGFAVSCGGDMNGDGLADIAMSAPDADGFGSGELSGAIYSLFGGPDGPESAGNVTTTFSDSHLGFRQALVLDADLSGDGLADLAIGAYGNGRVHLIFGPVEQSYDTNTSGPEFHGVAEDGDGHALDAGDVNGDGYADLAIGGPFHGNDHGQVAVIEGPFADTDGGSIVSLASVVIAGQDPHELTGWSVAIADDIDGDGNGDLVIGAPGAVTSGPEAGVVYLTYGPGTGIDTTLKADVVLVGDTPYAHFGHSVSGVPDIDGDGGTEVIVGAPYYDVGERIGVGAAFLFYSGMPERLDMADATATFIF